MYPNVPVQQHGFDARSGEANVVFSAGCAQAPTPIPGTVRHAMPLPA